MASEPLKILLAGMVAGDPRQGGATWAVLQYVAGLTGLGHEVVLVEQGLGRAGCPIPDCGRDWIPTLPPVALEHWPLEPAPPRRDAFTSVGHWRSYGSIEYDGIHYGQRAHSLRELIELPRLGDS